MQGGINKTILSHPGDEELARFVDNQLDQTNRDQIVQHLIKCDDCSDAVALVMKYGEKDPNEKKTPVIVNNINYKRVGTLLGGFVAVSLIIFIQLPNEATRVGEIDLSKPPIHLHKGATDIKLIDKVIDADRILVSITESTDLSHIESFARAKEEEHNQNYELARGLYTQAMIQASMQSDAKKGLQEKIVIHGKLLNLNIKMNNKKAIEEYTKILRYEIRLYSVKIKERE